MPILVPQNRIDRSGQLDDQSFILFTPGIGRDADGDILLGLSHRKSQGPRRQGGIDAIHLGIATRYHLVGNRHGLRCDGSQGDRDRGTARCLWNVGIRAAEREHWPHIVVPHVNGQLIRHFGRGIDRSL